MSPGPVDFVLPPVDPVFGVHVTYVSTPRADVIFVKVLLESFEGVASYRTQDPEHAPGRALIAVLIAPDFARDAVVVLEEIFASTGARPYAPTPADLIALHAALEPRDP